MKRRFALIITLCVYGLAFPSPSALARTQKPKQHLPTPAAEPAPAAKTEITAPGFAHLRLWKASDAKGEVPLQIRWLPTGEPKGKSIELFSSAAPYQFTGYSDVPVGAGTIESVSDGRALSRLDITLAKDHNCTVLVRIQKGIVTAELIDDMPSEGGGVNFNVFSLLFGGRGEVQVSLGETLTAHLNTSGGTLQAQGVKAALYPVAVTGTDSSGNSFRWNDETDLRKVRRATLIICLDAYGRIRPRLIEDGAPVDAPSADKANR